ncbi:MAG: HD domain-containing protein [Actinomycetota bacterium]
MSDESLLLRAPLKAWHLAARFVTSLPPTPPSIADEMWADQHLSAAERRLWVQLDNRDRRHSAAVARRFAARRPDATTAQIAGALLHDVGKIECRLGTLQRVAATVVGPITPRFRAYYDHEAIGAALARDAGSDPATVELIAGHGDAYPDLEASDHA